MSRAAKKLTDGARHAGSRSASARPPSGSGFTLVELLVVIAVLSLLMSILLPATSAARRAARTTVCGTTLRELARAWTIYSQEHAGTLVAGRPAKVAGTNNLYWVGNGWKFRPRWYITLGASVVIYAFNEPSTKDEHQCIDNRLLICPETPGWVSEKNPSYGYNFQFLGNTRMISGTQRFINFPVSDSHIVGDTVVAADSLGTAASFPPVGRLPNSPNGTTGDATADVRTLGFHGFMLDPPRLTPTSDRCDDQNPDYRGGPDARHDGKANFAFADGHVRATTPQALGYGILPDGTYEFGYEFEKTQVTNRRFSGTGRDDDPPSIVP
ncbi:MAG: prepilin-type N-terminal cleavage/methylation domain-containing protein [Phycisphaerae bacterium]|nr:prepilin-type N-terminal cleavage/methylation domain-containing protein [Phycisphaerae bacterium]